MVVAVASVEEAHSLYVLSVHTYMALMHERVKVGLRDYVASELAPVCHSGQSLPLLVLVGQWL